MSVVGPPPFIFYFNQTDGSKGLGKGQFNPKYCGLTVEGKLLWQGLSSADVVQALLRCLPPDLMKRSAELTNLHAKLGYVGWPNKRYSHNTYDI